MTECVRTATNPVSPALEKRKTSVQNVQKVCHSLMQIMIIKDYICMLSGLQSFIFSWLHISSSFAAMMFTLSSSSRAVSDRTANMCVKVSGGFLCQSAERSV